MAVRGGANQEVDATVESRSHDLFSGSRDRRILRNPRPGEPEIRYVVQREIRLSRGGDGEKVGTMHILKPESWTRVGILGRNFNMRHFKVSEVADEEAV